MTASEAPFLTTIIKRTEAPGPDEGFPFDLPWLQSLPFDLVKPVTFFVGENGAGKSTMLEAIADLAGLPVSGGSAQELANVVGPEEEAALRSGLRVRWRMRPRDGFFFRAEFMAHFASLLDARHLDPEFEESPYASYGGGSLHQCSHGEAFLALMSHRFDAGLFLLDEPESALSPQRQLSLLALMHDRVADGNSQFIVATHSPVLMTYPDADIITFDDGELKRVSLEETSHYQLTRSILDAPEMFWRYLTAASGGAAKEVSEDP